MKDPNQSLERTCFQTGSAYSDGANLRSDVAIVYGIDKGLPARIKTWRDRGYRIHVMTGVSWGQYQDYLYGRFDGVNHEDEAQTDRNGNKISHGGDVYYMCPGINYGKFLCVGVKRALDAGAEAIHLEEPEFWVRAGYSGGFKREWRSHYGEEWQPPHSSPDASWRAAKLKYFLYRRALQQVFDFVQQYNREHGTHVRCYVPTHSLVNYSHWRIVSPESSLARLNGCDGYIAQVWTGTSRTPNMYRGVLKERTFETAFLEYGAMQNLVRSTGRRVWYLNDPVEDNPDHDWGDYRRNWEATLTASLMQPEVWRYEVAPWPERVFKGQYKSESDPSKRVPIPPAYATELQTVMNALNDMNQKPVRWDCGTRGVGVMVSDSLMFERGDPNPSDPHMSHLYGLALPLLKRGIPVQPVQLENLPIKGYLSGISRLLMTYQGMKPLNPEVHPPLVQWVKSGGVLVFVDDDSDPYNRVREWWNAGPPTPNPGGVRAGQPQPGMEVTADLQAQSSSHSTTPTDTVELPQDWGSGGRSLVTPKAQRPTPAAYATPREDLFELLGLGRNPAEGKHPVGKGAVVYVKRNPVTYATDPAGDSALVRLVSEAAAHSDAAWKETDYLLLRRGPYVIAAGLDESVAGTPRQLRGRLVDLFDPNLAVKTTVSLTPGSRHYLLDLARIPGNGPRILASACKSLPVESAPGRFTCDVEGIADTNAVILLRCPSEPRSTSLAGRNLTDSRYDPANHLLWLRFPNTARPRRLTVDF